MSVRWLFGTLAMVASVVIEVFKPEKRTKS